MPKAKQPKEQAIDDLLRDLMIIELAIAGVGQHQIRKIVGVDIHRVSRIAKHIRKARSQTNVEKP